MRKIVKVLGILGVLLLGHLLPWAFFMGANVDGDLVTGWEAVGYTTLAVVAGLALGVYLLFLSFIILVLIEG